MNQRNVAKGLASLGRGADTSLIHMSPREIQALQQLAEQHGGSLTINPETGLPEAGFLNSLLPLIAGVGLSFIPGVNALGAGLLMGAGAGIASGGDLGQMAKWGLGGYGGASLGAGLAGAGAAAPGAAGSASGAVAPGGAVAGGAGGGGATGLYTPLSGAVAPGAGAGGAGMTAFAEGLYTPASLATGAGAVGGATAGGGAAATVPWGQQVATNAANTARGVTNIGSKGYGANFAAGVRGANPFGLGTKTAAFAGLGSMAFEPPEEFKPVGGGGTDEEVAYPAYAPLNRQALAPRNFSPTYNTPYGAGDSSEQDWFSEPEYRAYDPRIDPWNANYQSGVATAAQGGIVSLHGGGDVGEQNYFQNRDLFSNKNAGWNAPGTQAAPPPPPPSRPDDSDMRSGPIREGRINEFGQTWTTNGGLRLGSGGGKWINTPPPVPADVQARLYEQYTQPKNVIGGQAGINRANGVSSVGADLDSFRRTFAQPTKPAAAAGGGEMSYFNYAAGGLTAGPGDGMSDDIMTTISGRQRAALSPGEFVVPADVVSGIGNGDTSSGAKRLYAMMDGIRNGRTGKTAQPHRINPRLPA
jgi:hypothetical protein